MARIASWAGRLGLWLAIAALVTVVLSPIGYRLGWWGVPIALLQMLKWAVYLGIAGGVLSAIAFLLQRRAGALGGLVLALLVIAYPLIQWRKVQNLPYIHDITTDTDKPPVFAALAGARKAAPNGAEHKGADIARQQKQAYPDLVPFDSKLPPAELFAKAKALAQDMKWEIASADAAQGRLEASERSLLYGFTDDMVLRIVARDGGSRLDMRSMSRVGRSDVGVNAARISAFMTRLRSSGA